MPFHRNTATTGLFNSIELYSGGEKLDFLWGWGWVGLIPSFSNFRMYEKSKAKPNINNTKRTMGYSDYLRTFPSNTQGKR